MWYLSSLFSLLLILAAVQSMGAGFIDRCLPWRLRPSAREFLAPVLGLGLLLIPVTLTGWLGHGFRGPLCSILTLAMAVAGFRARIQPGNPGKLGRRHLWRLAGFAALASFPILGQLLRYNTFNPFNDTWTYLYQAQWLQLHGFRETAAVAGNHPAASSVLSFQNSGLRIAPSFLLGWLQAAFGLSWSYEIYPMAVSLALVCGALAVGAIVRAAAPGLRAEPWWVALAAAVTLNGFATGAVSGFFPQTVGLAFSTAVLALRGLEMAAGLPRARGAVGIGKSGWWMRHLRPVLPLAVCLASVAYCYPELLPFLAPALAVSYLLTAPATQAEARARWAAFGLVSAAALVLANVEIGRAFHALRLQTLTVAGNPVAWSADGFLWQSLGLRTGLYEGALWLHTKGLGTLLAGMLPVAGFGFLLYWVGRARKPATTRLPLKRRANRWIAFEPALLMIGLCTAAFLYFRYFVPNPWPNGLGPWPAGKGQSWSQFKLSLWAAPALLAIAASLVIYVASKLRAVPYLSIPSLVLALWCAVGLGWNSRLMLTRVNPIRLVSGEQQDPFGSYRAFCESLSDLPASDTIFLEAAPGDYASIKQRELLAYFLGERELIGDWTIDDNLPAVLLPPAERVMPPQAADWIVRYHPAAASGTADAPPQVCRLTVSRVAHAGWSLASVAGGYAREHQADGSPFYWTGHELHMTWHRASPEETGSTTASGASQKMKLSFTQHGFASEQTIAVRITGTTSGEQSFTVQSTLENRRSESEPFTVSGDEVRVDFTGSGKARRASELDARELSYLIGSATLEPVKD